ncbi:MAG: hypothetical protein JXA89_18160, partial [Anaerolineae bacterium]|nr:hypothetical protein [Anaerolineae bacterium]
MNEFRRSRVVTASLLLLAMTLLACINVDPGGGEPLPTPVPPTPTPEGDGKPPPQIEVSARYYTKVPTAFYHLLGKTSKQQNFSTFTLSNRGQETVKIKLISEIVGFTEQAIDTLDLQAGQSIEIEQTPIMKTAARNQLNQGQVASFHYQVTYLQNGDEKLIDEQSVNVDMMSKRDLVVVIVDENGDLVGDFREYVAAWVTPASPKIEELLRRATQYVPGEA